MNGASTRKSRFAPRTATLLALALIACRSHALPVDGKVEPEYGAARSVQTTQTSLGDYEPGEAFGSELDAAFGFLDGDTLRLHFAGYYNRFYSEFIIQPNELHVFIDTGPGGQNPVSGANPSIYALPFMTGLAFDSEFVPDYWLAAARENVLRLHAFYAELPAGGGGAGYFLGSSPNGGPGTLGGTGSNNPHGILATIDTSPTAGVSAGCGAASGAGVTVGIEWAIPLAALGNPVGPIRVCALLLNPQIPPGKVSNQMLGPVPPGTCELGAAADVDFASIPGAQYFVIDSPTPVTRTSWGSLKALYR